MIKASCRNKLICSFVFSKELLFVKNWPKNRDFFDSKRSNNQLKESQQTFTIQQYSLGCIQLDSKQPLIYFKLTAWFEITSNSTTMLWEKLGSSFYQAKAVQMQNYTILCAHAYTHCQQPKYVAQNLRWGIISLLPANKLCNHQPALRHSATHSGGYKG